MFFCYGHILFVFVVVFFSMFLFCFALNMCDGSVFSTNLISLCFFSFADFFFFCLICPCADVFFVVSFMLCWVWVKLNCYCFSRLFVCVCEWGLFILKNIISLFFMMTLNGFNGVCRRLLTFHLPIHVCFQWYLSVCDVFGF